MLISLRCVELIVQHEYNLACFFISINRDVTMRVTLWGQRAKKFSFNSVYVQEDAKPIVALFVACLAKQYKGTLTTSTKPNKKSTTKEKMDRITCITIYQHIPQEVHI
jgi:hypothetical protein